MGSFYLKIFAKISVSIDYVEITGVYSKVQEFYRRLSLNSIIYRFLHPIADPLYVYKYLWSHGCMSFLIYYENKDVGLLDITPCGEGAEVAIVIADAYQGKGLGKAVALDFAPRLWKMGFKYAFAYIMPENYKALSIAKKLGAEVRCRDICIAIYRLGKEGEICQRA
ncbi:GNAT family N-acetyltransferase [Pyrobaculum aerophilum]|uniref:GNAT family N-acetyltransferase n=1 Tax=Pyrobaculum aerophilum TaxID=13773 RepID=UPI0015F26AFE|nr:GNAT family N-acetyltransferase [Pyrobaculum aerophilum]